jgi:thiamine pyrophosphokinase
LYICYVVGAGEYFDDSIRPDASDFVIAADGGYDYLKQAELRIDLMVGDFDSAAKRPDSVRILELPKEKNDTDMMAALREGLSSVIGSFASMAGRGAGWTNRLIYRRSPFSANAARGHFFGADGADRDRKGLTRFPAGHPLYLRVLPRETRSQHAPRA